MKTTLTAAFLTFAASTAAMADMQSDAMEALADWQPVRATYEQGTLTVTLPQRRITEQIYFSVLTIGICVSAWHRKDFSPVEELVILNQFERQGYVYERGGQDCDAIWDETQWIGTSQLHHVLGATHLY